MRLLIFVILLLTFMVKAKAQNSLQRNYSTNSQGNFMIDSTQLNNGKAGKKWFVNNYSGVTTGIGFFNGVNANYFASGVGLQLNRKLSNNLYAFAGISVAPSYIGFNNSFVSANKNKLMQVNNLFSPNNFNMHQKAELGLMYINNQKTFSISGSISVEKSNYLFVPVNQFGIMRANSFNTIGR